jgi:hypothetical protein
VACACVLCPCSEKGTLVTYGNVSRDAQYLPLDALLSKDISIRGFNLHR